MSALSNRSIDKLVVLSLLTTAARGHGVHEINTHDTYLSQCQIIQGGSGYIICRMGVILHTNTNNSVLRLSDIHISRLSLG